MSKKRIFLLVGLLIVGFFELRQLFHSQSQISPSRETEVTDEATATGDLASGEVATVAFVIDGDTIDLIDGRRIRYIGIDAPETAHEQKPAECFGNAAKEENSKMVTGKTVRLEKDVSEKDSYGRLLRYVFIDDTLVNEQLVRGGFARAWNVPPDEKYETILLDVQQEAKETNRGLWRLCRK